MSDFSISAVGASRRTQPVPFEDPSLTSASSAGSSTPSAEIGQIASLLQELMQVLAPLLQGMAGQSSFQAGTTSQSMANGLPGGGDTSASAPSTGSSFPSTGFGQSGASPFASANPSTNTTGPVPIPVYTTASPATAPVASPAASPTTAAAPTPATTATTSASDPVSTARNVQEAAANTHPTFLPVLRGDEAQKDAQIKTQADFGRAVDQTAKEYGLDPNAFRAQLQAESGAFTQPFQKAMQAEGDLDRRADNNTSIGLGQISRKFLDGREWSNGGPGNARVGSQVVTTAEYMNSPIVQIRMAAANDAQRIADNGGLEQGLSSYVSGNPDPSNASAQTYLSNIDAAMNNPAVIDVGRD